jgi:glutaredoxin 3
MTEKRNVEVFSAGCAVCEETVALVQRLACPSCEVTILDMKDINVAKRAKALGVRSVPAVAVNGKLADCCAGRGVSEDSLKAAGIGQAI